MRGGRVNIVRAFPVLAAALMLTACSGESTSTPVTVTVTADAPSAPATTPAQTQTPEEPATATSEPTTAQAATAGGPTVGDTQSTDLVEFTIEEWKPSVNVEFRDGENLAAAMVRACVIKVPTEYEWVGLSWMLWSVQAEDGSIFQESSSTYGNWPKPIYPNGEQDGTFSAGDCARGWIYFDTNADVKLTTLRYDNPDVNSALRWTLP